MTHKAVRMPRKYKPILTVETNDPAINKKTVIYCRNDCNFDILLILN